jgi:hypothetical protein
MATQLAERARLHQKATSADKVAKLEKTQTVSAAVYGQSQPLYGTLAAQYLRRHRGIEGRLPSDLRFSPAEKTEGKTLPALLVFARNPDGSLGNFQKIYLDPKTGKKAEVSVPKRTLGSAPGASVRVQAGDGVTFIAEGIETALSIKETGVQGEILSGFGRSVFQNSRPSNKHVILVADYDGEKSQTHDALQKDQAYLEEKGYSVSLVWPTKTGTRKIDFNDVLREHGVDAVQNLMETQVQGLTFNLEEAFHPRSHQRPGVEGAETIPSETAPNAGSENGGVELDRGSADATTEKIIALDGQINTLIRSPDSYDPTLWRALQKELDTLLEGAGSSVMENLQEHHPKIAQRAQRIQEDLADDRYMARDRGVGL